jgi:hypothetical protein
LFLVKEKRKNIKLRKREKERKKPKYSCRNDGHRLPSTMPLDETIWSFSPERMNRCASELLSTLS